MADDVLAVLRERRSELQKEIARVERAINALRGRRRGRKRRRAKRRGTTRRRRRAKKPSATAAAARR